MTVSVVNGFLCYSSCDVKKAAQGVNPHPKQDPSKPAEINGSDTNPWPSPAVVLDGSLKASRHQVTPVDSTATQNATSSQNQTSKFETYA